MAKWKRLETSEAGVEVDYQKDSHPYQVTFTVNGNIYRVRCHDKHNSTLAVERQYEETKKTVRIVYDSVLPHGESQKVTLDFNPDETSLIWDAEQELKDKNISFTKETIEIPI